MAFVLWIKVMFIMYMQHFLYNLAIYIYYIRKIYKYIMSVFIMYICNIYYLQYNILKIFAMFIKEKFEQDKRKSVQNIKTKIVAIFS